MISLTIDHVTVAGSSLATMQAAFAGVGLTTEYGGPHANGVTHMALLGFKDGSYIELISTQTPEPLRKIPAWGKHIVGDGGPCAWAVQVDDVAAEAARGRALGLSVEGPSYNNRQRPDKQLVEWDSAFFGDKGATIPFVIKDITPRSLRVRPSVSVAESSLTGVSKVVLGVGNLKTTAQLFQKIYDWPAPQIQEQLAFGAKLAYFANTPVVLAEPLANDNWLANRLEQFSDSPCAYLLGTSNFLASDQTFQLSDQNPLV